MARRRSAVSVRMPASVGMVPLPSQSSAQDMVTGVPGALPRVLLHFVGRAAIIATGIHFIAREPRWWRAGIEGLAGSAAIEAFVLVWCVHKDGTTPISTALTPLAPGAMGVGK